MLRSHCKMSAEDTGILVLSTAPLAPAAKLLQKGDVLLAVDSLRIANDGTIPFTEGSFKERVQLNYYFSMRFPGESVNLEVLRNGQRLHIPVPLCVPKRLVPRTLLQKNIVDISQKIGTGSKGSIVGGNPSYLVVGGFVFISLSREYLEVEFDPEHMHDFEHCAELLRTMSLSEAMQTEEGEEAVILSHVIASDCNVGYETLSNVLLKTFGGVPVRNLRHLKAMTDAILSRGSTSTGTLPPPISESSSSSSSSSNNDIAAGGVGNSEPSESLVFELSTGMILVMDRDTAVASQDQICKEHFIPALCSSDLTATVNNSNNSDSS